MINKENYEAYFLDYIEGNLSQEDTDMLLLFLDRNPELKNELEGFGSISLTPTSASFDINSLKKVDLVNDTINESNFEEFAIATVENELNASKQRELQSAIQSNPSLEKEFGLVSKTLLKAKTYIKHPDKSELKKSIPLFIPFLRYGSVAAILLLMIYFFIPKGNEIGNSRTIAQNQIDFIETEKSNRTIKNVASENAIQTTYETRIKTQPTEITTSNFASTSPDDIKNVIYKLVDNNDSVEGEENTSQALEKITQKSTSIIPYIESNRQLAGFVTIESATPEPTFTDQKRDIHKYLSPKEFLTSLFKEKILKSDDKAPELTPEDFNNALASATNDKVSFKKDVNEARFISIQTKNFSFEKKISQ